MLYELYAENFALIDKVKISFTAGLNAVSGETGAGKSVIIDAVSVLMGGRFHDYYLRSSCDKCVVEGIFIAPYPREVLLLLQSAGFDIGEDEEIVLSREVNAAGRSVSRINQRPANVSFLKELSKLLLNIHGQSEYTLLFDESRQLSLLDSFGGDGLQKAARSVDEAYNNYAAAVALLKKHEEKSGESLQKQDFLTYQIKEIEKAALTVGEDDDLEQEFSRLSHGETLARSASDAYARVYGLGGAMEPLAAALSSLRAVSSLDKEAEDLAVRLENLYYELEDTASSVDSYKNSIVNDPYRLEEVGGRIAEIIRLKKKYGTTIQGILDFAAKAAEEYDNILNHDDLINKARQAAAEKKSTFDELCVHLSALRRETAGKLNSAVTAELKELYMPEAYFEVSLEPCPPTARGVEKAVFLISPNIGEAPLPVSQIASGGELSRIILAIKVILAQIDQVPTLIFDEVDSGLGGGAISAVSRRLHFISEHTQVICVTHSPVLAAAADSQVCIYKKVEGGRTFIRVKELESEERIGEIARMLAGENITEVTIAQVKELLKK